MDKYERKELIEKIYTFKKVLLAHFWSDRTRREIENEIASLNRQLDNMIKESQGLNV